MQNEDCEVVKEIQSLFGDLRNPPKKTDKEIALEKLKREYPGLFIKN